MKNLNLLMILSTVSIALYAQVVPGGEKYMDKQAEPEPSPFLIPEHENIRGSQNYN